MRSSESAHTKRRLIASAVAVAFSSLGLTGISTGTAHASPPASTGARMQTTGDPVATGGGRVFYVDAVNGSDAATGLTTAAAWRTQGKVASSTFAAGDVIAYRRGQTFAGTATVTSSGTSANPLVITAYGSGSFPLLTNHGGLNMLQISGSYVTVSQLGFSDGAVFDNSDGLGISGSKYRLSGAVDLTGSSGNDTVTDNDFTNVGVGVKSYAANTLITHNTFHDLIIAYRGPDSGSETSYGALGISINNSYNVANFNRFINCRSTNSPYGADGGAVEIEGFDYSKDHIKVDHNYSSGTQGFIESAETTSSDVQVFENVSDDYQQFIAFDTTTTPTGWVASNNTVIRSLDSSNLFDIYYYRQAGPSPAAGWLSIRNNIFKANGSVLSIYNWPHNNNLIQGTLGFAMGAGDLIANPLFVNAAGTDYHLTATSPAIDNGISTADSTDLDNSARTVGPVADMGAFEYQSYNAGGASITNDGGFETQTSITSSSTPWYSEGSSSYGVDVNQGKAHTGLNNAWIYTTSSNWGAIKQTLAVQSNSTYRMSVWVRNSGNFDQAWVGVKSTGGTSINEVRHGAASSYQKVTVNFTTGSNTTVVVHVGFYGPGAAAWEQIDDLTVSKI